MPKKNFDYSAAVSQLGGSLGSYLQSKGINTRANFPCINAGDHKNGDKNPSMRYYPSSDKAYCFTCGKYFDKVDVVGLDYGITDPMQKLEKAREIFGSSESNTQYTHNTHTQSAHTQTQHTQDTQREEPEEDYSAFFEEAHSHIRDTKYWQYRGLTEDTINRFNIGYVENWINPKGNNKTPSKRLIVPTGKGSYLARSTENNGEYSKIKVGSVRLFNADVLTGDSPVFVVEGEIDALSLEQIGCPAVSIGGVSGYNKLVDAAAKIKPRKPLILALDNDDAGIETTGKLERALTEKGIPFIKAKYPELAKDPNDMLVKKELGDFTARAYDQLEIEAENRRKEYRNTYSGYANFSRLVDEINTGINNDPVPTGFTNLNQVLDGGFYPGLYVLVAIPSIGKTALAQQLADQVAAGGTDVLMIALEMSTGELIARSLSRITAQIARKRSSIKDGETARRILRGADREHKYPSYENEIYNEAKDTYLSYSEHVYFREGIGDIKPSDIRVFVDEHIQKTGNKPLVIVDYLQILQPQEPKNTDKQNTDYAVLELKKISRDYKIPVLAISSSNRAGYNRRSDMSQAKESGAIEYSADVLIGLQPRDYKGGAGGGEEHQEEKRKDPREIELYINKNRSGKTGARAFYHYYPAYNLFDDAGEDMD